MPDTNEFYNKQDDRQSKKRSVVYRPMTFFLIIVAIIFVMGVFFRISVIKVEGNSAYTAEEIISASGIHTGDNLFFINRIGAGSRVVVKLPYIENVRISRKLPNAVILTVEESKAVACVRVDDELWSISRTGKYLSTISETEAEKTAFVRGIEPESASVGDLVALAEDEQPKLDYLLDILYQIQARGLVSKVSEIDLSTADNPVIEYDGRFVVKLGARDNTEYKFGKLLSAVGQLTVDDAGTMDLSDSDKVTFSPN